MFVQLLNIAKIDLHLGSDWWHAWRAQDQVDEYVGRLMLICHQVVLEPSVALSNVKGRHDGVGRVCERIAIWRLDLGSGHIPNLRSDGPLIGSCFNSILVELYQRPFKPLDRRKDNRECFGVVQFRFQMPFLDIGTGEEMR